MQVAEPAGPSRGRFVVLEGIDGCGKTTQLEALGRWLPGSGLLAPGAELIITREPGGTALGTALRQLLLHPPGAAAPEPMAELLLYAADRAQHVEQCIRPALAVGHWVLSDRFSGSTAAYQGYGRGLDLVAIAQRHLVHARPLDTVPIALHHDRPRVQSQPGQQAGQRHTLVQHPLLAVNNNPHNYGILVALGPHGASFQSSIRFKQYTENQHYPHLDNHARWPVQCTGPRG